MRKCVHLKQYLLENCRGEITPASDTTFQIGYYADGKKKYSISSEIQLAEALSLAKNGIITLWVDPHKDPSRVPPGKKRKATALSESEEDGEERSESSYDACLSRLRKKHKLPEFKLRCWARMMVNGTHDNDDNPPDVPFFTGKARGTVKPTQPSINEFTGNSTDVEKKTRIRSAIDASAAEGPQEFERRWCS